MRLAPRKHREDRASGRRKALTREGIDEDPEGPAACRHTDCTAAERVTLKKSRNELSSSYTMPGSGCSRPCFYKPHRTAVLNGHRDSGPAVTHLGRVQGSRIHTPAIDPPPLSTASCSLRSIGFALHRHTRDKEKGVTADHYRQSSNHKGRQHERNK